MSAARGLRIVASLSASSLGSLLGWVLIAPVAALVPKRPDWVAIIGRQRGAFLDNAKYFLLQGSAAAPDLRLVFVTGRQDVESTLHHAHATCVRFPSFGGIWFLMRCATVVVDESAWFREFRYFLLIRAKRVQLWHGVGCKWIEASLWQHEARRLGWAFSPKALRLRMLAYHITGRRTRYAAVVTTSLLYRDAVFMPAFDASHFPIIGYPRNDFARSLHGKDRELAWSNVDAFIKTHLPEWQRFNRKLVLVAPTFRDSGGVPMQLNATTLQEIDAFAEANGVEFIFKFHPAEKNADSISGKHFHVCARDSDIYPVMPYLAALVTDYSSISMDFLLIDKPLLFLIPEDDDYATNDRQLQFDPRTMMPGPVVPSWGALLPALLDEWAHDHHARDRATLRSKAFDDLPQSEAVPKLLALMRNQGWIESAPKTTNNGANQDTTSR